ncbi:TPA: S24 family peptidase [Serratia fonticola]|nr:S24 family peptidase [Serratia fonticola]
MLSNIIQAAVKSTMISRTEVAEHISFDGKQVTCRMPDDTMSGEIEAGEHLAIDTTIRRYIEDGIFAFYWDGIFMVKRLQFTAKAIRVIPSSKFYQVWEIEEGKEQPLLIVAESSPAKQSDAISFNNRKGH